MYFFYFRHFIDIRRFKHDNGENIYTGTYTSLETKNHLQESANMNQGIR